MKRTRLIDLGVASYVPVWRQQEELHNEIIAAKLRGEETGNCMIFVEHNHVYTLGKSGNEANMLVSAIQLQAAHAEFVKVNRSRQLTQQSRRKRMYAFTACVRFLRHRSPAGLREAYS